MIVGISHLSLITTTPQKFDDLLKGSQYELKFRELNLENHHSKRSLLNNTDTHHDIYFYESTGQGVSIEIIKHSSNLAGEGYFAKVVDGHVDSSQLFLRSPNKLA